MEEELLEIADFTALSSGRKVPISQLTGDQKNWGFCWLNSWFLRGQHLWL